VTIYAPTLFGYDVLVDPSAPVPGGIRKTDPPTSHLAATNAVCVIKHGSQRSKLLRAFASAGSDGLTDEQAGTKAYVRRIADTRRCSELRRGGLIEPTGETRELSTGCQGMVCRITGAGLVALREIGK
jgi:hypothetical protein